MIGRSPSVVRRMQLRLLGDRSVVDTEASLASQISQLKGRVARLHRLGTQYGCMRLSQHVEHLREAEVAEGCGGCRITTEV